MNCLALPHLRAFPYMTFALNGEGGGRSDPKCANKLFINFVSRGSRGYKNQNYYVNVIFGKPRKSFSSLERGDNGPRSPGK